MRREPLLGGDQTLGRMTEFGGDLDEKRLVADEMIATRWPFA